MVGNLLGDYQHEVKIGDEVEVARGDREDAPLAQWRRPVK